MKQQIILWVSAFVITMISIFLLRIIDPEKPVTGTVEFGGEKVSYKFDRVFRSNDNYKLMIFSKLEGLGGILQYKLQNTDPVWNRVPLELSGKTLSAEIPKQPVMSKIIYRVILEHSGKEFIVPQHEGIDLQFLGRVSVQIMAWYYITIFGGLLLSFRIGLEYFNENDKIKKLSFFAFLTFFFYSMLLIPVKRTYELSAFGKSIPQINQLFSIGAILIIILWVVGIISFFRVKNRKLMALIVSVLTLFIFIIFGY